jgi:hypothetical protein
MVKRGNRGPKHGYGRAPVFITFLLLLLTMPARSQAAQNSGVRPFSAGTMRLSLFFGGAVAFDQNYTVYGLGGGLYVADGIEVGVDAEAWSGNSPHIEQVSPQIRVVVNRNGFVKPYAGVFYRRTHIEAVHDYDTVGARAGAYFPAGPNAYFGGGLAQDVHLKCERSVYASCTELYPELFIAIVF